jgi:two-component system CitB family sensor kinase
VSLRVQLLSLQVVIVLVLVGATAAVASAVQEHQLRQAYLERMTGVAQSVARLPAIHDAFDDPDPAAVIQPIAELIREASDVTYVVVTNDEGIRYSHPNPDRVGEMVSTDPSVPLSGEIWTGTQTGTLGRSWRVKVPIYGEADDASPAPVIGTASVGILESELRADWREGLAWMFPAVGGAVVVGVVAAGWVTRVVRRRIFRLEPEEIAALLETRDAMLHGITEGVVGLDLRGRVVVVNDEALRLLGLDRAAVVGVEARDVLDPQLVALAEAVAPDAQGPADGTPAAGELVLAGERVLLAHAGRATVDGRDVGTVLVLRDRTELHTLLRDLDGARGLTDALRAQSHEFANTLHVVSGLLELGHVDEAVSFVARVGNGGLLTASGVAPGVQSPEVAALLLVKATTSRERGVAFEVDAGSRLPGPSGPVEEAWHGDVLTVLGNLIDNAVDASGPGGRVRVLVTGTANAVRVVVDDDGPGVPADARSVMFEPGFSTKHDGERRTHGRGIGLALVQRVAARRGGAVRIATSPLGGARFEVRLLRTPVDPARAEPGADATSMPTAGEPALLEGTDAR